MTAISARRRSVVGLGIFTLLILALLLGLGFWQLQRRAEKHALIAALTERLAAPPAPLPPQSEWASLTPAHDEYRRVQLNATYTGKQDVMVYSSGSALRSDVSGPGTWAFLPASLPSGDIIVVNAGFVPNTMQDRAQQDRAVKPLITGAAIAMTGYLRFPETSGSLTPRPNMAKWLWFARDTKHMDPRWGATAPFYIDLEAPAPESGIPKPGPLDVHLKDDHLQYAITWFGLAGAVLIAFVVWMRGQRRGSVS